MTNDEVLAAIGKLRALAPLDGALRKNVCEIFASVSTPRRVNKGTIWLKQGKPSENKGYILLLGSVSIDKPTAPVTSCAAPELIGEGMQFNPTHVRTATVTADEDCAVLRFMWEDFWKAVDESLSESEVKQVREAVEDYAWTHFAE